MSESFPRQQARTRHFSLGTPRNFAIAADGSRVAFLRSRGGADQTTCLWLLDVAGGDERLVVDPTTLMGDDGGEVPPEERARRERAREVLGWHRPVLGRPRPAASRVRPRRPAVRRRPRDGRRHGADDGRRRDRSADGSDRRLASPTWSAARCTSIGVDGVRRARPRDAGARARHVRLRGVRRGRGDGAPEGILVVARRIAPARGARRRVARRALAHRRPGATPECRRSRSHTRRRAPTTRRSRCTSSVLDGTSTPVRWDADAFEYVTTCGLVRARPARRRAEP